MRTWWPAFDDATYVDQIPWDTFRTMRDEAPVAWVEEPDGPGFWAVTRHADVAMVSRENTLYSSEVGGTMIRDADPASLFMLRQMMLNMDPPRHTAHRLLVNRAFTPRRVQELKDRIAVHAAGIVERAVSLGDVDLVEDVSGELPLFVICELLGVPASDRKRLYSLTHRMHTTKVGENPEERRASVGAAMAEMLEYASALAEQKRREPGDDMVSALLAAEIDGERLSEIEYQLFFMLLFNAGGDTTRNLVAGGVLALLEHPEQLALLRSDDALLMPAVEELLRWVSPVIHFRRTLTADAVLGGQAMKAGDKLVVVYASANRDERAIERPDEFDITRSNNNHLAFGGGAHFCLGASLARMEIRLMFQELLQRTSSIERTGDPVRAASAFINTFEHVPVRLTGR